MVSTYTETRKQDLDLSSEDGARERKPGGPLDRNKWLLDQMATLTGGEFKVAFVLSNHSKANGLSWPSIARIGEKSGMGKSAVYRALKGLEAKGVSSTVESGKRVWTSNTYKLAGAEDGWGVSQNENLAVDSETLGVDSENVAVDSENVESQNETRDSQNRTTNPVGNPVVNPKINPSLSPNPGARTAQPERETGIFNSDGAAPGKCDRGCGANRWGTQVGCLPHTVETYWTDPDTGRKLLAKKWGHQAVAVSWYEDNPADLERDLAILFPPEPPPVTRPEPTPWQSVVKDLGRVKGSRYCIGSLLQDVRSHNVTQEGETLTLVFSHAANLDRFASEYQTHQDRIMETVGKHYPGVTGLETGLRDGVAV